LKQILKICYLYLSYNPANSISNELLKISIFGIEFIKVEKTNDKTIDIKELLNRK